MCDREQNRVKLCCRGAGVEGSDTLFHSLRRAGAGSSGLPHRGHWRNLSVIHPGFWMNDTCLVGGEVSRPCIVSPLLLHGCGGRRSYLGVAYPSHGLLLGLLAVV